jgi:hypothetical protein
MFYDIDLFWVYNTMFYDIDLFWVYNTMFYDIDLFWVYNTMFYDIERLHFYIVYEKPIFLKYLNLMEKNDYFSICLFL